MKRLFFRSVLVLCGTGFNMPALAMDWVVLESNAPGYAAGEVLNIGSNVNLTEGHRLTLLSSKGDSRTLEGPVKLSVAALEESGKPVETSKLELALDRLISPRILDETQTGTVRTSDSALLDGTSNLDREARSSLALLPWDAMTSQVIAVPGTTQCIREGASLSLRRIESTQATVRIKKAGGEPVELSWAAQQTSQPWPKAVPIQDRAIYLISQPGRMVPADVLVHVVPNSLSEADPQFQIARLAGLGCLLQARLLKKSP